MNEEEVFVTLKTIDAKLDEQINFASQEAEEAAEFRGETRVLLNIACKRLDNIETEQKCLREETTFARYAQKYPKLFAAFIIFITSSSTVGIGELLMKVL